MASQMVDSKRLYELIAHYQRRASAPGEHQATRDYYAELALYLTSVAEELDSRRPGTAPLEPSRPLLSAAAE